MTEPHLTYWYLIRHAPVAGHHGALYKEADMPADVSDRLSLDWLAAHLPRDANWWASPRRRAVETAQALQKSLSLRLPIWEDTRLGEQNFGDWQGLDFHQLWSIIEDLPAHNWSLLAADTRPPGGESFLDVWQRVGDFITEHTAQAHRDHYMPEKYVIVAHAGTIRAFVGQALGLDPERALSLGMQPLSLCEMLHQTGTGRGGAWQLLSLNRTAVPNKVRSTKEKATKPDSEKTDSGPSDFGETKNPDVSQI